MEPLNQKKLNKSKDKIHSEIHYIAEQMWEYYNKKESFGLFLGLIKRKRTNWGYKMLSDMQDYLRQNGGKMPIKIMMADSRTGKK